MTGSPLWREMPIGTLVDSDIRRLAEQGELITEGFDAGRLKQACYELRASTVFYETSSNKENKRVTVGAEGYILRPHSYVTAIVMETVELPANVLGRILTKGQLFSVGILPVCTYADPGFGGRLGITLCNVSHRHIHLRPGDAIAKIEFAVLPRAVERPYSGQHGYETEIWPIPVHFYATPGDLESAGIRPGSNEEVARSYGPEVARLLARVDYYSRRIWIQIAVTVIGFLILFALVGTIDWVWSVLLGVAGNLITNLVVYLAGRAERAAA
jgi:dCTP deaminase